jgi:hypothetical protein
VTRALQPAATDDTRVLVQTPCEALRPFVDRFLVVESTAAHRDAHLPEPGLVAAFNFRGLCRLNGGAQAPRAAITGLWNTVRTHAHSRDHAVVIVAFTTDLKDRAEETRAWARRQNAAGHKLPHILAPESHWSGPDGGSGPVPATSAGPITALLFLEARDFAQAVDVARAHPALRYGASVEVRPWAPPPAPPPTAQP